jgi:hypothetical protein
MSECFCAKDGLIKQILRPELVELFQWLLPILYNGGGILTILNGLQNLARSDEAQCLVNVKVLRIETVKGACDFYPETRGVQGLSIE